MSYKKYNDYELIYMVHENNEESNSILLEKYSPIIISLSNKYYKKFKNSGYEYDDFYQEALSAFYRAVRKYDETKDVLFYSFVVLCMDRALKTFSRGITSIKDDFSLNIDDLEYEIKDFSSDPNNIFSFKEVEDIVKDVIYSVNIEASSIIELKINGFTYREISELLDIPISTVEFKSRKARNLLRKRIREYYCK